MLHYKNEREWSVNDVVTCNMDNSRAIHQNDDKIILLAAFLGKHDANNIAIISQN
jgi:hypothetical protein